MNRGPFTDAAIVNVAVVVAAAKTVVPTEASFFWIMKTPTSTNVLTTIWERDITMPNATAHHTHEPLQHKKLTRGR